jgi:hypothetical protein
MRRCRFYAVFASICWSVGWAADVQAQVGFAWADRPSAARYTPSENYSYNEAGGDIVVQRQETGHYVIKFGKLGRDGLNGGHVQVTAYGSNSDMCKVERWDYQSNRNLSRSDAPDEERTFDVSVRCFAANGRPTDSRFTIMAGWPGAGPGTTVMRMTTSSFETLQDMIYDLQDQMEDVRDSLSNILGD